MTLILQGNFLKVSKYVDDLISGDSDVDSTFELYVKSKAKFITNSGELRTMRDLLQEKQVLELEGVLTSKLLKYQ